jgi:hypothetical protein
MYMTNDDLWAVLKLKYPDLEGGRDYLMGCKVPKEGFAQQEHAYIFRWNATDVPQPAQADLEAFWNENMSGVLAAQIAEATRVERDKRLTEADALVERAIDQGDAQAERAARDYRQALRDVPQQPGFPDTVDWPLLPQ